MWHMKKDVSKLISIIGLIILTVFIITGGFTYYYVNQKMADSLRKDIALKSEYSSNRVKNILENAEINTAQMAINPTFITYLDSIKKRADVTVEPQFSQVVDLLKEIKKSSNVHYLVWVANELGNFYIDNQGVLSDISYDVRKRPWYPIASGSTVVEFTEPYVEWGTGKLVFSSIKALRKNDNSIYGFVGIEVNMDTLPQIMNEARMTSEDIMLMVNPDGTYIYNLDSKKIINNKISDENDPLQVYSKRILTNRRGIWEIEYNKKSMYLVCYPASETGWIIISLIPKHVLQKEMQQTGFTILLVIGLAFLLIYLLIVSAIRKMEKNLNNSDSALLAKLEDEIQEKNIELAMRYHHIIEHEKLASLGGLVAGLTHEVNTPLGNCIATTSYLEKINDDLVSKLSAEKITKSDFKHFLSENSEGLSLLVNNLTRATELIKSFKQLAVDQSSNQRSLFYLKENIETVALSLKHEYKKQGHEIIIECSEELAINSYPGIYMQIFTNFIMNSIRHGFKGKSNGQMRFQCTVKDERLIIVYTDDGNGIAPENLGRIFEMFFTTNRNNGNNGLGMHIVQTLINDKLKGSIKCDSHLGDGVMFTIDVPLSLSE